MPQGAHVIFVGSKFLPNTANRPPSNWLNRCFPAGPAEPLFNSTQICSVAVGTQRFNAVFAIGDAGSICWNHQIGRGKSIGFGQSIIAHQK